MSDGPDEATAGSDSARVVPLQPARVVLASSSSIRRRLLARAGLVFDVFPADVDESPLIDEEVFDTGRRLAREKALKVSRAHPDAWVVGADQVGRVERGGRRLEKCATREDAAAQLESMGGVVHEFLSAACVARDGEVVAEVESLARVRFRPLTDEDIERYLDHGEWRGVCGAYRIEGRGAALVDEVEGSMEGVWGIPAFAVLRVLRENEVFGG